MRVLHVMASGARGGGANHLLGLLRALSPLGVECCAAVGGDGPLAGRLRDAGIPTVVVDLMRGRMDPRGLAGLWRAVQRSVPSLIHVHGTRAAAYAALLPSFGRRPRRIYTVHGLSYRKEADPLRHRLFVLAEALACRAADLTLSVARGDLDDLRARGCLPPKAGRHVPNAVDTRRYRPGDRARARAHLGLRPHREGAVWVGTTSRLVAQKAVGDLLDAVMRRPRLQLVVFGDGPERAALARHPAVRSGQAHLLGARDDVAACLPALDVFALASRWEGEPIALLEAMACGLPCVATRTVGSQEIIDASQAGLLVDVADPGGMAQALGRLARAPQQRRALGERGRTFAEGRSHTRQAQAVAAAYQALVPEMGRLGPKH